MTTGSGGQSSSHATVDTFQGQEDENDEEDGEEDENRGYDELDESQLEGAPLTQPMQVAGTRRRRPPCKFTPDTHALGPKGKAKTRRQ
jgi:hypothetical protein